MTIEIRSNGSKWMGQAPDSIEVLVDVLGQEPLDPRFEDYGTFCGYQPDGTWQVFGNFFTVSHVFDIRGTLDDLLPLMRAVDANRQRADYRAAR